MDSIAVSNYFIDQALNNNIEITPMKVLKLVYLAHGWHLGNYHKPLIDDDIFAWQYGPVIPPVYNAFRSYGNAPITDVYRNPNGQLLMPASGQEFLNRILAFYKDYTGLQLSFITHKEGSPWHQVYTTSGQNAKIPNSIIEDYYTKKVATNGVQSE